MSAPSTTWEYQPPHRPRGYDDQCYYRTSGQPWLLDIHVQDRLEADPKLRLYRASRETGVQLTAELAGASLSFEFSAATLRALHAALSDALQDIAAVEADRLLQESFDRISEEMRDAEEMGGPRCYYAHPDIHYVPADQVAAKVRELQDSGSKRFMVMADPDGNVVDASLDGVPA